MPSSINASTAGAGGVITTADASGILNLQSGGTTIATVQSTGFSLPTASTINAANTFGFKNRIINGSAVIAQRGNVAAVASTYTYGGADRILVSVNGLTSGTIQQITSGVSTGVSGNSQAINCSTSGVGSVFFQTRLESANVIDLNSKSVTISCKVYQDTGSTLTATIYLYKPTTTIDTFSAQTLLSSTTASIPSSTLTTVTLTYTLGAAEASLGLAPTLSFATPSSVTSKYFTITDWQLEVGSQATSFDFRSYGTELALCQRYYWVINGQYGIPSFGSGFAINTYTARISVVNPVSMRTGPTYGFGGSCYLLQNNGNGLLIATLNSTYVGITSSMVEFGISTTVLVGGDGTLACANNGSSNLFYGSAEL
jgi:hypothetical protein